MEGAHPHQTLHPGGGRVLFNSNAAGNADLCLVRLEDNSAVGASSEKLRTMRFTLGTRQAAIRWQNDLRSRLTKLLKMDDLNDKHIALGPKTIRTRTEKKYVREEVEISSTAGRHIPALVTTPSSGDGPYPAVVCIHGHEGYRSVVYYPGTIYKSFASSLASSGFVTIAVDVGQHEIFEPDRSLMGERLWDLMRCVDYLETLPHVDSSNIGCAGLSLGGEMAMWLGAIDERIAASVSSGFLTTMDQMEKNHCICWKFDGLRELVDYADIYSLIAPRAIQCQNGLREERPISGYLSPAAK